MTALMPRMIFQYLDGVIQTSTAPVCRVTIRTFQYLDGVIQTSRT